MTNITHYHFIGVGGIGMSGLAELLVRQRLRVSGSDLADGPITRRLADLGVRVLSGPSAREPGRRRHRGPYHHGQGRQPRTGRGPGSGA